MKNSYVYLTVAFFIATNYMYVIIACTTEKFQCYDGTTCIPLEKRCDNFFDCEDNSDEINCTSSPPCPEGTYKCETGGCVNDQTECPIMTSMLPSSIAVVLESSFVLPTTSSKFISTTSYYHSYVSLTFTEYSLSETWIDASVSSKVMLLPSSVFRFSSFSERLSTAVLSLTTQSTFHVQSSSAFISSSYSTEPTTTYNSSQTSVIETTPIDLVKTSSTEDYIANGGSNNLLYLLLLLVLLIPMTMFVVWRYKRKMREIDSRSSRRTGQIAKIDPT